MTNVALRLALAVSWLAMSASVAEARRVTTILGPSGDGTTPVVLPLGVHAFSDGTVYVADSEPGAVFEITPAGTVSTLITSAGDGVNPFACSTCNWLVLGDGTLYISGDQTDNVFRVDPSGVITLLFDATGDGAGNVLDYPYGLARDGAGNVYVAGLESGNVFKRTPAGAVSEIIDASGDGTGHTLHRPTAPAVDGAGNVFVGGRQADIDPATNVFKIDPGGVVTTILDASGDGLGNPFKSFSVFPVLDSLDNLYVAAFTTGNVFRISPAGTVTMVLEADRPAIGAVDSMDNVYVSSDDGQFQVTPAGGTTLILPGPGSIRLEPGDTFYVRRPSPDERIELITAAGPFTMVDRQSDGILTSLRITGWDVNTAGRLFVSDSENDRVLAVELLCDPAPRAGCRHPTFPGKARLVYKDAENDAKDILKWKWTRGEATLPVAFGNPLASDDVSLCLYSAAGVLVAEASALGGGTCDGDACWDAHAAGFKYLDKTARAPDGIRKVVLKGGDEGKAKITLSGRGANLPDLTLPLVVPILTQLQAAGGECWEATFDVGGVKKNLDTKFVGLGE